MPLLGDVLRYTISPIVSRMMTPLLVMSMSRRPSQLRASAVVFIAGAGDMIVNARAQSNRLAHVVLGHDAQLIPDAGHMVHYPRSREQTHHAQC
ncbi:MAG: hypothetical protein QOD51_1757 [Candidatus Eremiobacteraeota bacterium]|nr:hypothetical protein [Candidatus Eremiobacteraeota bacterium]